MFLDDVPIKTNLVLDGLLSNEEKVELAKINILSFFLR